MLRERERFECRWLGRMFRESMGKGVRDTGPGRGKFSAMDHLQQRLQSVPEAA